MVQHLRPGALALALALSALNAHASGSGPIDDFTKRGGTDVPLARYVAGELLDRSIK